MKKTEIRIDGLIIDLDLKSANLVIETEDGIECSVIQVKNTEEMDVQAKDQVVEIEFISKVGKITCFITLEALQKILAAAEGREACPS
jgi:hypothetical protein